VPGWFGCRSSLAFAWLLIPRSPAIMRANEPYRMARQSSEVVIVSSFFISGPRLPCSVPDAWALINLIGRRGVLSRPKGLHRDFRMSSSASAADNPFCL
jgi:hypothetical protein